MMSFRRACILLVSIAVALTLVPSCDSFTAVSLRTQQQLRLTLPSSSSFPLSALNNQHAAAAADDDDQATPATLKGGNNARRNLLVQSIATVLTVAAGSNGNVQPALADNDEAPPATTGTTSPTTTTATITNNIYIDLKAPTDPEASRLLIGLYGKAAPSTTTKLMHLLSKNGLQAPCKPRDTSRTLQKEQLEANKVYNACIENEQKGVTYEYGTIWRIVKDVFINVGSVSGKFIAREFPNWSEEHSAAAALLPIEFGSVSVTRGNQSGFGFTIHTNPTPLLPNTADGTVIVVGHVLPESMAFLQKLNDTPVVTSSKVGSAELRAAPSRSCAYGKNDFYCNEYKPLQKLSIVSTGIL
jgi:cyclophilin family peptidyl-prolyl cis-trans isomerase